MAKRKSPSPSQEPSRISLRWAVILTITGLSAVPAHAAGGPAVSIATAVAVLVGLQTVIR